MNKPLSAPCLVKSRTVHFPAHHIDTSGAWLFWTREPSPALRRSLEIQGQLFPVLVDATRDKPVLIAGAARLACLREKDQDVWCLDMGAQTSWDKGLLYLESNAGQDIGDAQTIAALRYFQTLDAERIHEIPPRLGHDPRSRAARQVLTWLALPLTWDGLLAAGHIPLACADLLAALKPGDLDSILPLFETLAWSRGNAVNMLTWLRETAIRDRVSISTLLEQIGLGETLQAGLSPKDTISRITAHVRAVRFPELTQMEQHFSTAARSMSAGTRWKLIQPDQFETQNVELSVRVASQGALQKAVQDLQTLAAHEFWKEIFPEVRP